MCSTQNLDANPPLVLGNPRYNVKGQTGKQHIRQRNFKKNKNRQNKMSLKLQLFTFNMAANCATHEPNLNARSSSRFLTSTV